MSGAVVTHLLIASFAGFVLPGRRGNIKSSLEHYLLDFEEQDERNHVARVTYEQERCGTL